MTPSTEGGPPRPAPPPARLRDSEQSRLHCLHSPGTAAPHCSAAGCRPTRKMKLSASIQSSRHHDNRPPVGSRRVQCGARPGDVSSCAMCTLDNVMTACLSAVYSDSVEVLQCGGAAWSAGCSTAGLIMPYPAYPSQLVIVMQQLPFTFIQRT